MRRLAFLTDNSAFLREELQDTSQIDEAIFPYQLFHCRMYDMHLDFMWWTYDFHLVLMLFLACDLATGLDNNGAGWRQTDA